MQEHNQRKSSPAKRRWRMAAPADHGHFTSSLRIAGLQEQELVIATRRAMSSIVCLLLYFLFTIEHSQCFIFQQQSSLHPFRRFGSAHAFPGFPSTASNSAQDQEHGDLLNKLKTDVDALTKIRPPEPSADTSVPPAIVSAGSSYTRIWTHHTWKIHSDPPHKRYMRHILRWHKSSTARIIMPSVIFACIWSIIVGMAAKYCLLTASVKTPIAKFPSMIFQAATESASPAFAFLSAPLALLLTLRANASMARLIEARQAWGRLVSATMGWK